MVADKFTLLLEDLSKHLSLPLKPDTNNSCLIVIQNNLEVQLELDPTEAHLIIGSIIGELPSGRFRQDCLLAALKANAKPFPRPGTFAYSRKLNHLVLFEKILLDVFDINNILSILTPFIKKAIAWKQALDGGHAFPAQEENYIELDDQTHFFGA